MIISDNLFLFLISFALGLSLPLIGVFVILRKEALLSDALAHTLLLGIALSVVFKLNAMAGIFAFAILAGIGIFLVKEKADLGTDAIVGVFFTTSLAIGSILISSEDLLEAFLGNLENITKGDVIVSIAMAVLIIGVLLFKFREFAFSSFSPDLAKVDKLNVRKYELLFVLLLSLGVAMGIKLVGTLLISALIIVPAATAKIFSVQIRSMALWSMLFGLISVFGGLVASSAFESPTGPTIILFGSSIFFLVFTFNSLLRQR